MTLHFLNDVANDTKWTPKKYVKIVRLKSETMGKLINRIPGSHFFYIKFIKLGFENAC